MSKKGLAHVHDTHDGQALIDSMGLCWSTHEPRRHRDRTALSRPYSRLVGKDLRTARTSSFHYMGVSYFCLKPCRFDDLRRQVSYRFVLLSGTCL